MKFYLIEITGENTGKVSKAIYEYNTLNEAVANFHSKLGAAMKSELYNSELVMVINSEGGVHMSEKYTKPIPAEEPVAEGE